MRIETLAPALVVDTNVASLPLKTNEPTKLKAYERITDGHTQILAFATVAELLRWGEDRNWGATRRDEITRLIERCVVAHSDAELCINWARLMGISKRGGHNLSHADAWIAATALTRDVALVSDNVRHFAWIPGLRLLTVS